MSTDTDALVPVGYADKIAFLSAMKAGKGCDVWPTAGDYTRRTGRELIPLYGPDTIERLTRERTEMLRCRTVYLPRLVALEALLQTTQREAAEGAEALTLLRKLYDCGAVTNWFRVSDELRAQVEAAIAVTKQGEPGALYSVAEFDPPVSVKDGQTMTIDPSGSVFVNGERVSTAKITKATT